MSGSFTVECPSCRARGELSDPGLLGQPIICPACQAVFTVPLSSGQPPIATPIQSVVVAQPVSDVSAISVAPPTAPGVTTVVEPGANPLPLVSQMQVQAVELPAELLAGAVVSGPEEELFASSLPQPIARGSIKPPKPQSVILMTVIWSTVSSIVLFAAYMFLEGDPWRGYDAKYAARDAEAARRKSRVRLPDPPLEDLTRAEVMERIRGTSPSTASSTPKEMPAESPADNVPSQTDTPAVPSLVDVPIDTMPAPEMESTVAASALNPENVLSQESLSQILIDDEKYNDAINRFPGDPERSLPWLLQRVGSENETIHERAWELLTTLARTNSWKQELRKFLDGDDVPNQTLAALLLHRVPAQVDRSAIARQLIPWVMREDFTTSHESAVLLVELGHTAAPTVAEVLMSDALAPDIRRLFFSLIEQQQSVVCRRALLPHLREALKSESPAKRQAAALILGRLNPREPDLLPLIVESLSGDDPHMSAQAATVLEKMAREEVDVSIAIPNLMKIIVGSSLDWDTLSKAQRDGYFSATSAMQEIGARPEQLPELRQMLRTVTELATKPTNEEVSKKFESDRRGTDILLILCTLGPGASEAVPDIKAFLEHEPGHGNLAYFLMQVGEPAITMLMDLARQSTSTWKCRASAIDMLGDLRDEDERILPVLLELLKDENLNIRFEAALALARIKDGQRLQVETITSVLREALLNGDKQQRERVRIRISSDSNQAKPFLPELLQVANQTDADANDRGWAIWTAAKIAPDDPDVQTASLAFLKAQPDSGWASAIVTCGEIMIPDLIRIVQMESDPLRKRAIELLGHYGKKAEEVVPILLQVMNEDQGEAAMEAAFALTRIDPTVPDFLEHVQFAYFGAFEAMRRLRPLTSESVPKLMEMIEERNDIHGAIFALGTKGTGAKPAIPLLVDLLGDLELRDRAILALDKLGENVAEAGPVLIEIIRRSESPNRLISILPKLGQAAEDAAKLFCDDLQNEETRIIAIERLRFLGEAAAPAVPQLLEFARSNDRDLRYVSMLTLGGIDSCASAAIPVLAASLSDPDPGLATAAASGLFHLAKHAGPAMPQILEALEQNRPRTQRTLLELLKKMGPAASDAIPVLKKLTQSGLLDVRQSARAALKEI